jgi:Na+-transporting methylmalonyl-CoA/oxaloacetate decarboxylase gamma subunit
MDRDPLDADREDRTLPSSAGIDQSIGYMVLGLGVVLFFFLTVFGMGRVEQMSTQAAQDVTRGTAEEDAPATEIGGASTR